jgi:hypothetical protein
MQVSKSDIAVAGAPESRVSHGHTVRRRNSLTPRSLFYTFRFAHTSAAFPGLLFAMFVFLTVRLSDAPYGFNFSWCRSAWEAYRAIAIGPGKFANADAT